MKYKERITNEICDVIDKTGAGMGSLIGKTLIIYKAEGNPYHSVMEYQEFYNTHDEIITKGEENFDYFKILIEEKENERKNTENVLNIIKKMVTDEYFLAINDWVDDSENGIWGNLKIVDKPIGDWQDEHQDNDIRNYWNVLKGMYIIQGCGYSGDDYSGTLEIKITENKYLRASFNL